MLTHVIPNRFQSRHKSQAIQPVGGDMINALRDYYHRRERAERMAADSAGSELARNIHLELAERYAALVRQRSRLSLRF